MVATVAPGCLNESENRPPRAIFETTVTSVDVGDIVQFDAANSSDKDGSITSYHWDFGDGAELLGVNVHHIYQAHGVFNVTLTVTDDLGEKSIFVQTIIVNALPLALIDATPDVQFLGTPIVFSASRSTDADGSIASFMWDFGDGNSSTMAGPEHTYADTGSFMVSLTVTDNRGAKATDTRFVRVVFKSYDVNFTLDGANLDNQRDFTAEGMATYVNSTIDIANLHLVRFRLSWRDNIKPPGGAANDIFRLTVTPPDGFPLTANGSMENLTLLFPLASIPINRSMEGKDAASVVAEVEESLGSTIGRGVWLVQVEAIECGGFRDSEDNLIPDPGNFWDLAVHYEFFRITVTTTE
jgi:PKD repeat protein